MNVPRTITVDLLSDATFGRGEGTPGIVDTEVEHDEIGLPYLGGKTLRGLLRDGWLTLRASFPELDQAAWRIYGPPHDLVETSILRIGDAVLETSVHEWVALAVRREHNPLSPEQILTAITDIRAQTSEDRETSAPMETTLRFVRVAIRGLRFVSPLTWLVKQPTGDELRCLALGMLATRHIGLSRNRGRGWACLALDGDDVETRRLAKGEGAEA